jgi:hypothetical protein
MSLLGVFTTPSVSLARWSLGAVDLAGVVSGPVHRFVAPDEQSNL